MDNDYSSHEKMVMWAWTTVIICNAITLTYNNTKYKIKTKLQPGFKHPTHFVSDTPLFLVPEVALSVLVVNSKDIAM